MNCAAQKNHDSVYNPRQTSAALLSSEYSSKVADTCLIPQQNRTDLSAATKPLNLSIPCLTSNCHRISCLALLLGRFRLLFFLDASLASQGAFARFLVVLAHPLAKPLLGFSWAFLHHFCAETRFLNIHIGTIPGAYAGLLQATVRAQRR